MTWCKAQSWSNTASSRLGGKDYICPVKSAALLKSINKDAQRGHQLRTKLNEVTFTGYHVLRGDVRILPEHP